MSNVRTFIGGKVGNEDDKQECIKHAEELLDGLKSGRFTSFAAVAVSENLSNEFFVSGSGTTNTDVIMTGSIYRLMHWFSIKAINNES